ncbi:MAG TPA: transporter substrate-binding domain-containing protein, partial [Kiritimatiellia bacterium]|nr:transporter substrate-binding domain-containing protein [Kiritimatiellia bacterium]
MNPPSSPPSPRPVRAGIRGRTLRTAGFAALAAACLLPAAPRAAPPPVREITVVSDDNYPPYIFRDADGVLRGILPDQWKLWETKTGVRVHLQAMDWAEAQRVMREKRADVIDTIFRTPEREQLYDFTPPYARIRVPVFTHRSLGGIADPSSLRGFTIGVKVGDSVIGILAGHGIDSLREYPSYEAIVQAAREDELRVFSVDEPAAVYYLYKFGIEDQFRSSFVLYTGEFHRAVHKGSPELL